ncbi:MAG: hypothetical protein ABDH37_04200 [Candidatus Hydrothermales bacterium]
MYIGKLLKILLLIFTILIPFRLPERISYTEKVITVKILRKRKGNSQLKFLFTERETFVIVENIGFEKNLLGEINLN